MHERRITSLVPDYLNMELSDLLDQLTLELAKHTQMLKEKQFSNQYEECKKAIAEINKVIRLRMAETAKTEDGLPPKDPDFLALNSEL